MAENDSRVTLWENHPEKRDGSVAALIEAIRAVEALEICRIDVGIPSEDEHQAMRRLIGVIEDGSDGYPDDDPPTRRLSDVLAQVVGKAGQ